MFEGAYDHTNDKIHVQCYEMKTAKQFIDFLKRRVDRRYNDKNIQNIFLVLDNLSVHKSKRYKKEISKCCPRIKFVFLLPVISPELNLIEVEDGNDGYKGRWQLTILHSKMSMK